MATRRGTWNLQDAKARLSELVDLAKAGRPQIVLRRGEPTAVVVSYEEFRKLEPQESLVSFLLNNPVKFDIDIPDIDEGYDPGHLVHLFDEDRLEA